MHTKSWLVAAALALVSTASAANAERPRIYFPRHVKRQFQNATITRAETFPSPEGSPVNLPLTTKREPSPQDEPLGTPDSPIDPPADSGVKTVYVETSTIIVTPTELLTTPPVIAASTGGLPDVIVLPTPPASESAPAAVEEPAPAPEVPSSSTGILLAPTGVVTPTSSESDLPTSESKAPSSESPAADSPVVNTTEPAPPTSTTPPPVVAETTTSPPAAAETTTSAPPEVPTTSAEPAQNVTAPAETTTSTPLEEPTPEPEPEPKPENPLDPILSVITSILPPLPTPPINTTDPAANVTTELPPPPPPTTTSLPPEPTPDPDPTPVEDTTTTTTPPVTEPPASTPTDLPTEPPPPPPPVNTTSSEPPLTTPPPGDPTTEIPIGNTTITEPPPAPTSGGFSITNSTTPTITADPTDDVPPTAFTSVPATGTITDQESWLPTTVATDQMPTTGAPTGDALAPTTTAALPSNLPKVISPNDPGTVEQPIDTVLLQIGLLCPLNYKYLSKTPKAAAQVFSLLPQALAYAADIDIGQIKMQKLVPLDTTSTLGCFSTICRFWYPSAYVDTLRIDVKLPYSGLYTNPDILIYNFTQQINPAIEIIPGAEDDPDATGGGSEATSTANPGGDLFNQPATTQTPKEMVTTAGIVVGSVGIAIAYGAAMFLVARRYKRKKQAHQRSSSVTHGSRGSSGMRYTGTGSPALMGGALLSRDFSSYGGVAGGRNSHGSGRSGAGNSGRTAFISAPVAAENSLGWN